MKLLHPAIPPRQTPIPIMVSDYALVQALMARFEASNWEHIGQFVATALVHLTTLSGREGLKNMRDIGIPKITQAIQEVVDNRYQELYSLGEEAEESP